MRAWCLRAVLVWALMGCQSGAGLTSPTALPSTPTPAGLTPTPTLAVPTSTTTATVIAPTATRTSHAFTGRCRALDHPLDWYDRLYFRGRGYKRIVTVDTRLGTPTIEPTDTPPFALAGVVGQIFAPWQAGDAATASWHAPPGTPIRAVQGIPPEEVLAVTYGTTTALFCADAPTPLAATRVVRGRVARALPEVRCHIGRCLPTEVDPKQVWGAVEVAVQEVWQGTIPGDPPTITVVALRQPGAVILAPGHEVVLLVRPQTAVEDFSRFPDPLAQSVWVAERLDQYRVEGNRLRWVGDNVPNISVADFRAGLAETFAGVTPSDPPAASPRP